MSYDGIGATSTMLDSLNSQVREAELRRAEAERAHKVKFFFPIPITDSVREMVFFLLNFLLL